jgi:hypothetical protein
MVPVAESVNIPFFSQFIDGSGVVQPNDVMTRAADAMLDELARMTALIRPKAADTSGEPADADASAALLPIVAGLPSL